jgi:hypothetical protein
LRDGFLHLKKEEEEEEEDVKKGEGGKRRDAPQNVNHSEVDLWARGTVQLS